MISPSPFLFVAHFWRSVKVLVKAAAGHSEQMQRVQLATQSAVQPLVCLLRVARAPLHVYRSTTVSAVHKVSDKLVFENLDPC